MAAEIKGSDRFASSGDDDFSERDYDPKGAKCEEIVRLKEISQQVDPTPERPPTGEWVQLHAQRFVKD